MFINTSAALSLIDPNENKRRTTEKKIKKHLTSSLSLVRENLIDA